MTELTDNGDRMESQRRAYGRSSIMTRLQKMQPVVAKYGVTLHGDLDTWEAAQKATISCNVCGSSWPYTSDGIRPGFLNDDGDYVSGWMECPQGCNRHLTDADDFIADVSPTIMKLIPSAGIEHLIGEVCRRLALNEIDSDPPSLLECVHPCQPRVKALVFNMDGITRVYLGTPSEVANETAKYPAVLMELIQRHGVAFLKSFMAHADCLPPEVIKQGEALIQFIEEKSS